MAAIKSKSKRGRKFSLFLGTHAKRERYCSSRSVNVIFFAWDIAKYLSFPDVKMSNSSVLKQRLTLRSRGSILNRFSLDKLTKLSAAWVISE